MTPATAAPWTQVVVGFLTFVGESTLLLVDAARRAFRRPVEVAESLNQMAFVGAASVPIVALTTFFSGSVLALYATDILVQYGATTLAGGTVGLAVSREIAPVLAGIMVAARCGSAMAAQIGTMAVTEQVDALRALSVHPTSYLVVPRVVACVVMLPVLGLVGLFSGVIGGLAVASARGVPTASFLDSIQRFVEPWDFLGGLLKTLVFGLIVAVVACQQGLRTSGGAVGVGRSTTNTVVISMVLIYIANFVLAAWLF